MKISVMMMMMIIIIIIIIIIVSRQQQSEAESGIILINNMSKQYAKIYLHAQYWHKSNKLRGMIQCAQLHFTKCKEIRIKLGKEY